MHFMVCVVLWFSEMITFLGKLSLKITSVTLRRAEQRHAQVGLGNMNYTQYILVER